MMTLKTAGAAGAVMAWGAICAAPVIAEDVEVFDRTTFSIGVSSVGLTAEVGYRANENWRLRGLLSGAPTYRSSEQLAGISYDTTSKLRGLSLFADRRLGKSNFYLSLGAFISENEATGKASGTFQIGDNIYTTTLKAKARFNNRVAPVIALRYDLPLSRNWFLSGTAGYIYTGGIDVNLNGGAGILPSDLIKEKIQAQNDLGDGYPFIELGLNYVF